jgi:plasmid stabilization system protein ParE
MPRVVFGSRALADLERIVDFHAAADLPAGAAVEAVLDALRVLERHPAIGHPVEGMLRELVISRGRTGYVALYRFVEARDRVDVLAIRHQREAGYG